MNVSNFGVATGRLVRDPKFFTNKDGSRKVMFTVACRNEYKDKDGNHGTNFVPIESFIPKTAANNGVYDYMHAADRVTVGYTIKSDSYTDKDGVMQYPIVLSAFNVELLDSRSESEARRAAKAGDAGAADTAVPSVPADAGEPAPASAEEPPFGK